MNSVERRKKKHARISAIHSVSMATPKTLKPMRDVISEASFTVEYKMRRKKRWWWLVVAEPEIGRRFCGHMRVCDRKNNKHWIGGIRCAGVRQQKEPQPKLWCIRSEWQWKKRWRVLGIGIMNVFEWLGWQHCTKHKKKRTYYFSVVSLRFVVFHFLFLFFVDEDGFASVGNSQVILRRMNRTCRERTIWICLWRNETANGVVHMKHMMRGENFRTKDLNEWGSRMVGTTWKKKNICERVSEAVKHAEAAKKEERWCLGCECAVAMDE